MGILRVYAKDFIREDPPSFFMYWSPEAVKSLLRSNGFDFERRIMRHNCPEKGIYWEQKMDTNHRDMVQELCDQESGLTAWECDFVSDMMDWKGQYSDKQKETIEKIYAKVL